jgi:zinc transporter ZupT
LGLESVMVYGVIPLGVQLLLGGCGTLLRPSEVFCSCIQHLSGGVITAAIFVELMPMLLEQFQPHTATNFVVVILASIFGVTFFSLLGYLDSPQEDEEPNDLPSEEDDKQGHTWKDSAKRDLKILSRLPKVMLFVIACGLFLDGLLLPLSYYQDTTAGLVIAISFAIETGVLGFLTSTMLKASDFSSLGCFLFCIVFVIFTFLGEIIGSLIFGPGAPKELILFFLAFGIMVFLYMIIDSLLVEARKTEKSMCWYSKFCFYTGFLVIFFLRLFLELI